METDKLSLAVPVIVLEAPLSVPPVGSDMTVSGGVASSIVRNEKVSALARLLPAESLTPVVM